jgi:hypothetical protein
MEAFSQGSRETNASEPPLTRRNYANRLRNQGRLTFLGQACQAPDYRAGGDRRIGGVTLIWALVRNCGNQSFDLVTLSAGLPFSAFSRSHR